MAAEQRAQQRVDSGEKPLVRGHIHTEQEAHPELLLSPGDLRGNPLVGLAYRECDCPTGQFGRNRGDVLERRGRVGGEGGGPL